MHLQKSILPFTLVERLLKTNLETLTTNKDAGSKFRVFNDKLFYRNLASVAAQRSSCASITNYIVTKRVRQKALLNRMLTQEAKMLKIQKVVRGHLCRVRNKQKVDKIKRDG